MPNQVERLLELESYGVIDVNIQTELKGLVELAASICNAPISLINLLDAKKQVTKAEKGFELLNIPKESSFCQYTIEQQEIMIVNDASKDRRFKENPFVKNSPNIRFYAGVPLKTSNNYNLGTLCVLDKEQRELTEAQQENLALLADEVMARLELIKKKNKLQNRNEELKKSKAFLRNSSDIKTIIDPDTLKFLEINSKAPELLGGNAKDFVGKKFGNRLISEDKKKEILSFISERKDKMGRFVAAVESQSGETLYLEHSFTFYDGKWFMTARNITDREKTFIDLQKNQRKTNTILDAASDCIIIADHEGKITQFNTAAEETFGYTKNEILGQKLTDTIVPNQHREGHEHGMQHYINTGKGPIMDQLIEMPALKKDGTELTVELRVTQIGDTDPPQFLGILRDISERIKAQKKLRKTLTNLAIGQELAEVGSWTWNIEKGSIKWSEKVYDICGIDNVSLKPTIDLFKQQVHPADRDKFNHVIEKVRQGAVIDRYEHRLLMPNGDVKWVRHSGRTTYNSNSKPIEINGAIQDITKQKIAQLKLEREKQLSDEIINSLPISFFMFDRDGNAIRWNDKVREFTGYSEQQIAYMHPRDFVPAKHQKHIQKGITEVFRHGKATLEANLKTKDGQTKPHILSASRFKSQSVEYFLGTAIDISEIKEYEKRLENSLEEKEVLLSEIHHRVKNNLAIISGLLQLESFNATDDGIRNTLQNSQMRIHSMAQVHEMLYNSNDFTNLSFKDFVSEIVNSIKSVYQQLQNDITFELNIESLQLNVNQAIPCGLIINEVVTNAYKHAFKEGEEGRIQISLSQVGDTIRLNVKDNGRGLRDNFSLSESSSLGFKLIETLTSQLNADINIRSQEGTQVSVKFQKENIKGAGSSLQPQD